MNKKNYGIGRYTSIWWNEGQNGKSGFYTVQICRKYKNSAGEEVEQRVSLFADDLLRLSAELERAKAVLLMPREIIKQQTETEQDIDSIPF